VSVAQRAATGLRTAPHPDRQAGRFQAPARAARAGAAGQHPLGRLRATSHLGGQLLPAHRRPGQDRRHGRRSRAPVPRRDAEVLL